MTQTVYFQLCILQQWKRNRSAWIIWRAIGLWFNNWNPDMLHRFFLSPGFSRFLLFFLFVSFKVTQWLWPALSFFNCLPLNFCYYLVLIVPVSDGLVHVVLLAEHIVLLQLLLRSGSLTNPACKIASLFHWPRVLYVGSVSEIPVVQCKSCLLISSAKPSYFAVLQGMLVLCSCVLQHLCFCCAKWIL